jgi:hypothetical protein
MLFFLRMKQLRGFDEFRNDHRTILNRSDNKINNKNQFSTKLYLFICPHHNLVFDFFE